MGKSCCAIDCKNRFSKKSALSFYRLPKAREKRSKWIAAICRSNWNPSTEAWICSCHFVSGKKSSDPLHPDYVPSLFSFTSTAERTRAVNNMERYLRFQEVSEKRNPSRALAATALLNLHQIKTEVEMVDQIQAEEQTVHQIKTEVEMVDRIKAEEQTMDQIKTEVEMVDQIKAEEQTVNQIKTEVEMVDQIKAEVETVEVQDTEVQTEETHNDIASLHERIKSLNTECQSLRDKVHKLESELKRCTLDFSEFDDSKMKIFTGLPNLQTFMLLFSCVSSIFPATTKQSLKPTQELLLTLMKLHHNLSEEFLGHLFAIHQSTVSRIFRRWVQVMASKLPVSEFPQIKAAVLQHVEGGVFRCESQRIPSRVEQLHVAQNIVLILEQTLNS